ncbi:MAG: alpha/beta hydrolase [Oscillospiraceae bacterium]|nr:alpha/beta hydrolase [Oscillospiraceae bacterium]
MKKILKRIGIAILIFLLIDILAIVGLFIYHRIMLKKEAPLLEKTVGTPVSIDGGTMYVYSEGEGEKTVVFLSGYGTSSPIYDFKPLYSRLTDEFRIAVVEKFGYGFSDETDLPRDLDTMLSQTRRALTGAGIEAPYILVPHSASGMEALYWAQQYPDEVSGILFSDAAIPGAYEVTSQNPLLDKVMAWAVDLGAFRVVPPVSVYPALSSPALTEEEKQVYLALFQAKRGSETLIREAECAEENMKKVSAGSVPEIPMIFYTSTGYDSEHADVWCSLPDRYTGGTAKNVRCQCGHYVHAEKAEEMASSVRELAGMIDEAKQ